MASLYIEHTGKWVTSSELWDDISPEVLLIAIKKLRESLGKPTEINGRNLS